jgi:hypothetical protein
MFRYEVMQYWVHEYIMDTYVCEKCTFTLFIDTPSYKIISSYYIYITLYPVWRNHNISKRTKLRIFNTNAKSVLYACETWKVTQHHQ